LLDLEPTKQERRHIWRCFLIKEILIGSEDDVWTAPSAYRALATLRHCMSAIKQLVDGQHGIEASFIKAIVMQTDGMGQMPFALDEVAEYLCEEHEARRWWQSQVSDSRFPHRCPECGSAAYIGLRLIECRANCRE
jgi:hypothetical protein